MNTTDIKVLPQCPPSLIAGYSCTVFIGNNNELFYFGDNDKNKLGFDNTGPYPRKIRMLENIYISMVDCGTNHTICLDVDGNVYSFGNNAHGQLGLGSNVDSSVLTKLNMNPIRYISCGFHFTICISCENFLYTFGRNDKGQLSNGNNNENSNFPLLVSDLSDIEIAECGGDHVTCKIMSGEYYSWGQGEFGQLGHGNLKNYSSPKQSNLFPLNCISIKSGSHHTLILDENGDVYGVGRNQFGQLGIQDVECIETPTMIEKLPKIQRIECGYNHSLCIDLDYNLWIFGNNEFGQLGLGNKEHVKNPQIHKSFQNIIDISSSGVHTFVKITDTEIYSFGDNDKKQLGISTNSTEEPNPQNILAINNMWKTNMRYSKQKSARK